MIWDYRSVSRPVSGRYFVETRRRLVRRIPGGGPGPMWLWDGAFLFANRHLIVVCTQTCIFRCCIVLRQLYACCMSCCNLVAVMLWYHVEIRGIWQCHMSRWDRYVLRPRIWMETSRSEIVPHIGPYSYADVNNGGNPVFIPRWRPYSGKRSVDRGWRSRTILTASCHIPNFIDRLYGSKIQSQQKT